MSSHVIHVIVDLDEGWGQGAEASAIEGIAHYIETEVMQEFGRYGHSDEGVYPFPTVVRAIT